MLFFDLETHLIEPGRNAPPIVCMAGQFANEPEPWIMSHAVAQTIRIVLERGTPVGAHNAPFDLICCCAADPSLVPLVFRAYREGRVFDTEVREKLLRNAQGRLESSGFGLSDCAERRLGVTLDKSADTWQLRYAELDGVPLDQWPQAAIDYPRLDVKTTKDLFFAQVEAARKAGLLQPDGVSVSPDEARQTRHAFALDLVSTWGITTDLERVEKLAKALEGESAELAAVLGREGLLWPEKLTGDARKAELAAWKACGMKAPHRGRPGGVYEASVQRRVTQAYGGHPPLTENGNVKTDGLTCEESGDATLVAFARFSEVGSMISKNLPLLRQGQVHTWFGMTANGRSSSKNPNIQNINRKGGVRPCFIPRPGCKMIAADYGSLELCTLAQFCLDTFRFSVLADELRSGLSPLLSFAASMLGISYEEAAERRKNKDPKVDDARQSAKVALYGFPGGLGTGALCGFALSKYDVRITRERSEWLKHKWQTHYREMPLFLAHATHISEKGWIEQPRSGRVRGAAGFTDTCNTLFSGLGADVAKGALFDVQEHCYARPESELYGWRPINFVHDSVMAEGPPATAEAAARKLSAVMIESAREWLPDIPITAPWKVSDRWEED